MTGGSFPEVVLAHQGGWDELLLFGAPVVLMVLGVRWAERRGAARRSEHDGAPPVDPPAE